MTFFDPGEGRTFAIPITLMLAVTSHPDSFDPDFSESDLSRFPDSDFSRLLVSDFFLLPTLAASSTFSTLLAFAENKISSYHFKAGARVLRLC